MITCAATGLVYRNPKPHLRAVHAWHPSLVLWEDGELVISFDLGQAVESLDYRTYLSRSQDGGQTWQLPIPILDDKIGRCATHSVRISRVADGTLVAFGGRYYRDDPEEGLVNRSNLGYAPMDLLLLRSPNRGRTWEPPQTLVPPLIGPSFEICHAILELPDGRWLAPTATWKGWDGQAPNGMKAIALVSYDQGRTWPEYLTVLDGSVQGIIHWEQSLLRLMDGRLLAVAWAFDERSGRSRPTPYALSADGRTFAPPGETGLRGQTAKLLQLRDGRILCLYRRDDQPGLWANLARVEGEKWVNLDEAPLWQGAGSGMTGRAAAGEELSALRFGYPSLVQLPAGEVLAVFWCREDCVYQIRWLRIHVG